LPQEWMLSFSAAIEEQGVAVKLNC